MSMNEIKRMFIFEVYKTKAAYRATRKKDYFKVQFEWSCFIDLLCKNGVITQHQYDNAIF